MAYNIEDGLIDYRALEGTGPSPEELAAHTAEWTKFFSGGGWGGGLAGMTPARQAELVAAALKANPLEYGYHGQSSEGPQEFGALMGSVPLPKNVFPLLTPQEQQQQMQKLQEMEAARGPDWMGDLVLASMFAITGMGAMGLLGPAAGTFTGGALAGAEGASALAGGIGADTLAGVGTTAAADAAGLAQMAADAGLTGAAADAFVASGGALGSTAAAGGSLSGLLDPSNLAQSAVSQGAQSALDIEDAAQGAAMTAAGNAGGGAGINSPLLTGGGGTNLPITNVLSSIFGDGTASANDWLSVGGSLGSTLLGLVGADAQSDAYSDVAQQYLNIGQPFRNTLQQSYQPGFSLFDQPGYGDAFDQLIQQQQRLAGVQHGNVGTNPSAWGEIGSAVWNGGYLPALSSYRGQLGQFGGLGLNTAGAGSLAGAGSEGGIYNALGGGLAELTTPRNSWDDLLRQFGTTGNNTPSLTIGGTRIG